jgi:hypothetical protein
MSFGRRYRLGWVALALTVGISACGGDDSDSTQTSGLPVLTKAQFLKQANAICRRGTEEMNRLDIAAWKKYGGPSSEPDPATSDRVALALLPPREKEVRLIRALGLPQGDEEHVEKMLTVWEEGIERSREDPQALRAGRTLHEAYSMGLGYGLIDCWLS